MVQESRPGATCSPQKSTFCVRHPLQATLPPRSPGGVLPWRGAATPRFILAPTPSLPRRGRGVRGGVGEEKKWGEEGERNERWGVWQGCAKCTTYAYPHPPPSDQDLGSSLWLLHAPLAVHLIHVGHCPNGWQHKLGRPNICPQPDSPAGELTPDWPPERSALPTLLDSSCKDARGMACWRAPHPA